MVVEYHQSARSAATRKHIMVGQNYLRGGGAFGGQKCNKYNKINNNSENCRESKIVPDNLKGNLKGTRF